MSENRKKQMCQSCLKCDTFTIDNIASCAECEHNGAYDEDEDEYVYDEEIIKAKGIERTEAQHEGQCQIDTSLDNGCMMITCTGCGYRFIVPMSEA